MSAKLAALAAKLTALTALLTSGCMAQTPALKDAFKDCFRVGVALNQSQFGEENAAITKLIKTQFNSISPENVLKWEAVHPEPAIYDFALADAYVAFGQANHMWIVGHNLVWHSQTPNWVFQDNQGKPLGRDALLARMRDHISTVVGRYKGRINSWDVVNEALEEDGKLRQDSWMKIIGPDYIAKAFEFAHEADPDAELCYNDFSMENEPKRNGALALIKKLKDQGAPVTAVGLQGHIKMDWPTMAQLDATIDSFAALGVKVNITELDVDVLPKAVAGNTAEVSLTAQARPELNPYPNGLPPAVQKALAKRYADLFATYVKHRGTITRVTFWGVTNADSWLNDWPVMGRTSYPLLFDREGKPTPAFDAVIKTAPNQ
ncbi:MAG: endo-1,4-beta-xylanase [Tepidisphaeraceae bacterium]|jgi:endo-1,4-beta-xylanase